MIQKFFRTIYNFMDMLFGGGINGKQIQNGRKLTFAFTAMLLYFACAIIGSIWLPPLLVTLTDPTFAAVPVALVAAYLGSNVLHKKVQSGDDKRDSTS